MLPPSPEGKAGAITLPSLAEPDLTRNTEIHLTSVHLDGVDEAPRVLDQLDDDIVEPAVFPAGLRVKTGVADMSLSIFNIDNSSQAPIRARTFVNRVSAAVKIGDLVQRTHRRLARTPTEAGCRTVAR